MAVLRLRIFRRRSGRASRASIALAFFCLLPLSGCIDWIGEPLQDAAYRTRGDQITRADAKSLVFTELAALGQRCPEFSRSGANWLLNYALMMDSGCVETGVGSNSDFLTGCSDLDFLGRQSISDCRLAIAADSCSGSTGRIFPVDRLAAYVLCAAAFESNVTAPFAFF